MTPSLPAAISALNPIGIAQAATPGDASLASLAQMIARGDDLVTPNYLKQRLLAARGDFTLVDIRDPADFAAGHISGAVNIPVAKLLDPAEIVVLRRKPQVIVYSGATDPAAQSAVLLRVAGVPAVALSGGLGAWANGLTQDTSQPQSAAIVRALNDCPELTPAVIPALNAAPPAATPAAAPATPAPAAKPKPGPVQLNGMCG
ncbi:MAG TPA: rhodanese-like domain-containing protein [Acidocella sp.]|nr:rhodanese-like domain-containing protein [Acidocella sp.]